MTTRIRHSLTYHAPLADVAAMLADAAFREEVCRGVGVIRHDVRVTGVGAGMEVVVERVQASQGIPSFATKFVGDEITYVQTETWPTVNHGDVAVAIPGKPGEMSGTIDLTEAGGVTDEIVVMDVKVGIPLLGGRIESMVGDLLVAALKIENGVGRDYLSR